MTLILPTPELPRPSRQPVRQVRTHLALIVPVGSDGLEAGTLQGSLDRPVPGVCVWIHHLPTPANTADNEHALHLLGELPGEVRYVLGDQHYNDPTIRVVCAAQGQTVVATKRGTYPHTDNGVMEQRVHRLVTDG